MAEETGPNGAFFKGPRVPQKVQNKQRHDERKAEEQKEMDAVRKRDPGCRFPLCGCRRLRFVLDVSHQQHRGIGGNPAGDRTDTALMVLVCRPRHRGNFFSVDRGTVEWRALTDKGADGPISWHISYDEIRRLSGDHCPARDGDDWIEVARESEPGTLVPPEPWQHVILEALAEMTI